MGGFRRIIVLLLFFSIFAFSGTVTATNSSTELVSIPIDGGEANDYCYEPSINENGRYVAFSSYANNLVDDDTNFYSDIFVRDRLLNITERISVSSTGEKGNDNSYEPFISSDGRYVTFTSYATNLVKDDVSGFADIFVRDRLQNITERLSVSSTGVEGNNDSYGSSVSSDGRYIAFYSWASNLVEQDTNGCSDVFVFDRISNTIKIINIPPNGGEANSDSYQPIISADGNFIAFTSNADNLVVNDNNGESDVFVYDQNLNNIKMVSISEGLDSNGSSYEPSISSGGRYIAFSSWANNLVEHDFNGFSDVFVYDQISGIIERVSILGVGEELDEDSYNPSISGDGRFVAFVTGHVQVAVCKMMLSFGNKDNIVDIFVHDRLSKTTKKISVSSTGEEANDNSDNPAINGDGKYVAFSSHARNLVLGYNNDYGNIFVHFDNKLSSTSANLYPKIVKSGDIITVSAYSPSSIRISVLILGKSFEMEKRSDGLWYLDYAVPIVPDGVYNVLLTAADSEYNQEQVNLNFTVDNTNPVISATVTPNLVKSGDRIFIEVVTSPDTVSVTAIIQGETFDVYREDTGWKLYYWILQLSDGNYPILLTAIDKAGNQNSTTLNFTVDNTPPFFSGLVTPDTVKTNDNITITAISDSDTLSVSALILNQTYNLIKQSDGTWILIYAVPYIFNDNYPIILTATDSTGNTRTFPLSFNVFNPLDNQAPVVSGTVTHTNMINGVFPSKPSIYFQAFTDPDVISVTASVLSNVYTLNRQEDGTWTNWYFNWLETGSYTVLLTAQDWSGNQGNQTINFTVLNTIPTITSSVTPNQLKSGDILVLTVNVNPDPWKVYVYVSRPTEFMNLEKQANGSWVLNYTVPNLEDGYKTIYITCLYGMGWFRPDYTTIITAESTIGFTVDNTPPNFSVSLILNPIRSGDTLGVGVSCATGSYFVPDDTVKVTATVFGNTLNLNWLYKWSEWYKANSASEWGIETIVPTLPDGIYPILITATDDAGNQNTKIINLTVDNTPPTITATITPDMLKFVDFSKNREMQVYAQSSSDTKNVFALIDNSWRALTYSNGQWILNFGVSHIITLGTHNIQLNAFDYAENVGICYVSYTAVDYSNFLSAISGGNGGFVGSFNGNSGSDGSSGSSQSGYNGDPSRSGDSSETPNEAQPAPDYTWLYVLAIIVAIILILALLYFIGALSIIGLLFALVFDIFIGILGVLYECMLYLGLYVILNPFAIVLDIMSVFWAASRSDLLEVILGMISRWVGIEFEFLAPISGVFADVMAPKTYYDIISNGSKFINDKIINPLKYWIWG
ncbi:MAG: hypothetical protein KO318_09510 [Methanobacterium sp.]|jgi:hypothetical protein|uniref:Ig-like domain-containing protein n=1 Tax=Methanobacterium sp. TaxID=2164 RepID=UPI0025890A0A|nr:Ig-like domain-containing protein [Methanobacterium sp.]MCC7560645.1 hypothetical protein [Methanobacterium sp.]